MSEYKVISLPVIGKTRKLKSKWTVEYSSDFNAIHNEPPDPNVDEFVVMYDGSVGKVTAKNSRNVGGWSLYGNLECITYG